MAPLKVLFVSSEVTPFRKTGGLADVAGSLPKALARRGIDVRVVTPLYRGTRWDELEPLDGVLEVPTFRGRQRAGVRLGRLSGSAVPIYFLEHHQYYDREFVYGPPGSAYSDNLERFVYLSRAALELTKAIGWVPDIVHANDWQTAVIPVFLNTFEWGKPLHGAASIFSIHNLAYQGNQEAGAFHITGLGWEHFSPNEFEHFGDFNPLKAALVHSTMLSTVSPTYAREIQTGEFGCGLDGVLASRSGDLRGILNGIDTDEWDPTRDPYLPVGFSADDLAGKAVNKAALQKELGLPVRPEVPLYGVISRLTPQKGLDVLAHALERLLTWDIQICVLGTGDREAEQFFSSMSQRRGDKIRSRVGFDNGLSHRIEAGIDFFIMPSRFEPCGLNQMYSLRYGSLPIVRATGGLVDTVANYDESTGEGTGFVFGDLSVGALADTVGWSLSAYHNRQDHLLTMRRRAMAQDFSWGRAAAEYERLYLDAYQRRRKHPFGA